MWWLRVIGFAAQQGVEEGFTGWLLTAAMGLDSHEYGIDFLQLLRIVEAQHPPPIGFAVHVEDPEIRGVILFFRSRVSLSPNLERAGGLDPRLAIEVEGIKNQRFVLGIENTAERFARAAAAVHIEDIGDIELARSHELTDVAVGGKILFVVS